MLGRLQSCFSHMETKCQVVPFSHHSRSQQGICQEIKSKGEMTHFSETGVFLFVCLSASQTTVFLLAAVFRPFLYPYHLPLVSSLSSSIRLFPVIPLGLLMPSSVPVHLPCRSKHCLPVLHELALRLPGWQIPCVISGQPSISLCSMALCNMGRASPVSAGRAKHC